jgi:hypothetical protein
MSAESINHRAAPRYRGAVRKARVGVGLAVVFFAVAVVFFATCRDRSTSSTKPSGSAGSAASRDPSVAPEPAWFGVATPTGAGRRITGTAYRGGAPVAAQLTLASTATDVGAAELAHATAGPDGRFDLGLHRAGTYRLLATAPGAVPRVVSVDCETADADVEVYLSTCKTVVTGEVRDASGGGIASAAITRSGFTLATTDAAGTYELCIGREAEAVMLVARADGYAAAARAISGFGAVELDFDLVPEASVVVHVVDTQARPVAGAVVRARPSQDSLEDGPQPATGVTDADGTVELLAPTAYDIAASAAGLVSEESARFDATAGEAGEVTVLLVPSSSVRGRAVESGAPVAGLRVRWIAAADGVRGQAITAADGTFAIADVPPGAGAFAIDEPGFVQTPAEHVASPDAPQIDVEVVRPRFVRGIAKLGGGPVGGAILFFVHFPGRTTSKIDGTFELPLAPVGKPTDTEILAASAEQSALVRVPIHLEPRQDIDGFVVELKPSSVIAGVVVDQSGAPVPEARLTFDCQTFRDTSVAVTGPDGTFAADLLRGGCVYEPAVRQGGGWLRPAGGGEWTPIDVAEGGRVSGVRLVASVVRTSLSGVVVDANGAPVPDALVVAQPGTREARSDVQGRFTLSSTQPGPFSVEARASGARTARLEDVAGGSANLRLALVAPGFARVICDGAEAGLTFLTLSGASVRRDVSCGKTSGPLPPGPFTGFGDGVSVAFTIAPGATTDVRATGAARVELDVTVVGAPATGISCRAYWHYLAGESRSGAPVPVTDGAAHLVTYQGTNRVWCGGEGLTGSQTLELAPGAGPVTITLAPRPPRPSGPK